MPATPSRRTPAAPRTRLARRLAAAAGAVGAATATSGTEAALVYVPTAGVAAAQNIPGFSFTAPNTVVAGALRPPATSGQITYWDIDGNGGDDFWLYNAAPSGGTGISATAILRGGVLFSNNRLRAVPSAAVIGPTVPAGNAWQTLSMVMTRVTTNNRSGYQPQFPNLSPKQFAFRFATPDPSDYYYGWGTLTIDLTQPIGSGYTISEAFYQTTPGGTISVGAVPVPEPTGLALLALGASGLAAWRARRR